MFGVDIFNYGHTISNVVFQSDENDFVFNDEDRTLGFVGTATTPSVRITEYKDYIITHTLTNDTMDYDVSGLDPKWGAVYTFDIETTASKDGVVKKTWTNNNKQFKIKDGAALNEVGQPFKGYIFILEDEAAKWIRKDIENNKTTCADENKVENEDGTCGDCLDGFMLDENGECISCSSMNQKDGIGGVCGNCKDGFIVDEDEESDSYGNCIEESPADNTILYAGGGLIALAVVATLMKK